MNIIYAPSYQSLIFVLENHKTNQIEIITRNESIYKFCLDFKIKCKVLKKNNDLSIKGLFRYKKYLSEESNKIKNKNIYFFFHVFGTYDLFFIKKLVNNNNIYFKNLDPNHFKTKYIDIIKNWKATKYTVLNWVLFILIFKMKFTFYTNKNIIFLGYDLKKLKQFKYKQPVSRKSSDSKFKNIIKKSFNCIYICSGRENDNLSIIIEIQEYLNQRGISFGIKEHPNAQDINVFQKNIPKVKSYIPSEFLIYSDCNLIIGDYSVSLNKISEHIKTISLFKLFKSNNKMWNKEILENHLTNKKISFPENLNVFKKEIEKHLKN